MKNFNPMCDYVLIKLEKRFENGIKKTKNGILLPELGSIQKDTTATPASHNFIVEAIGPDVKNIKVGSYVIFNEYDLKGIKDDNGNHYGICKEGSIYATYEN